jgi:hypothetical protein
MSDPSIKKRTKKRRKKAKGASGEAGAADGQSNGQEKVPKVSVMIGPRGSDRFNLSRRSWSYQTILFEVFVINTIVRASTR